MRMHRYIGVLFVILSVGQVFGNASMDPLWIYKDLADTDRIYNTFQIYDTSRKLSIKPLYQDTIGDKYDSNYINLDYQFSADTMYVLDDFSPDTLYKSWRPGYAGFKIDWDAGVTGFKLSRYKHLIMTHNGPLLNHKVTIRFGYNTVCGSPTVFQTIGSFPASATWKVDTIAIPDFVRNISAKEANSRNYYEIQVLITNADPSDTNKSSLPGSFKVDNIGLCDSNTVDFVEPAEDKKCGCGSGTGTALIPPLFFKALAYRRRKKNVAKV